MTRHPSETTLARIRKDGGWDRRFRATCDHGGRPCPRAINTLPLPSVDTRIPPVRLANWTLSMIALWLVILAWAVSLVQ